MFDKVFVNYTPVCVDILERDGFVVKGNALYYGDGYINADFQVFEDGKTYMCDIEACSKHDHNAYAVICRLYELYDLLLSSEDTLLKVMEWVGDEIELNAHLEQEWNAFRDSIVGK